MTTKILEKDIQRAICDYLALKRYFFWRQNTAPTFNQNADRYQAMPKYSKKGVPDIILVFKGQFIGLEVKRQGGKQSEYQLEFEKEVKENGGKYYVVSSINDVINLGF